MLRVLKQSLQLWGSFRPLLVTCFLVLGAADHTVVSLSSDPRLVVRQMPKQERKRQPQTFSIMGQRRASARGQPLPFVAQRAGLGVVVSHRGQGLEKKPDS